MPSRWVSDRTMKFKTIEWKKDRVRILDQRRLPQEVRYIDCKDVSSVAEAIRTLAIRGAPAIGVAAAMGVALAARRSVPAFLTYFVRI